MSARQSKQQEFSIIHEIVHLACEVARFSGACWSFEGPYDCIHDGQSCQHNAVRKLTSANILHSSMRFNVSKFLVKEFIFTVKEFMSRCVLQAGDQSFQAQKFTKQWLDGEKQCPDTVSCTPLVFQDVQANVAMHIYIGVEAGRHKLHLRRLEGILCTWD